MRFDSNVKIYIDDEAFPGVKRVAGKVADDFEAVLGKRADVETLSGGFSGQVIIAATLGKSAYLDKLIKKGEFDKSSIEGKWEVYSFSVIPAKDGEPEKLLIAGSDKRGTIYGLFHVSEILGVSPWYWFADAKPVKKDFIEICEKDNFTSKVPSVKYRGFFINDEWPAFGNWTFEHFGGFTAKMYDHVFELLLRLKGNYLWPAMWTSNFSLDGPGLENARLADEYGVVMSNSHHEPCLRHSEEWDLIKGEDTPYGTAWNFDKNKEGLSNYWRGGLLRNGKFENIITMGMRGERDSEVLGATATLKDNIDYIKDVVKTQNELIKETIDPNLDSVPRMIAIYKEVEKYFHGDETTEGFKTWDGIDGITCMLCEDNFGNLRTLPEDWQRDRKGGWGMYYHFDYHGDPISYEWINSTHIARTCEQMSQAYEYGIKEIWIVNVGDLKPQEFPLSYFLDLAYDIDKWGVGNKDAVKEYTKKFVEMQFASLTGDQKEKTAQLLEGYTRLNYIRKPEALSSKTYHPTHYGESDKLLKKAEMLEILADEMEKKVAGSEIYDAYFQLVTFPVKAAMNLLKMQLFAGQNHLFAKQGAVRANYLSKKVKECIDKDRALCKAYHELNGGKWNGLALSEHVGFTHWNDEECAYPIMANIEPANRPRMIVSASGSEVSSQGGDWTRMKLILDDFVNPSKDESFIVIKNGSEKSFEFEIENLPEFITADKTKGTLGFVDDEKDSSIEKICLKIDREKLAGIVSDVNAVRCDTVTVRSKFAHVDIDILSSAQTDKKYVPLLDEESLKKESFFFGRMGSPVTNELGLVIPADKPSKTFKGSEGEFVVINGLGKFDGCLKAFPTTKTFNITKDAPCAEYTFKMAEASDVEVTLISAPNNPVVKGNMMAVGLSVNNGEIVKANTVQKGYEGGERTSPDWAEGVLNQCHVSSFNMKADKGENTLRIYAQDPGVVIERILIRQAGSKWAYGYLGTTPEWI